MRDIITVVKSVKNDIDELSNDIGVLIDKLSIITTNAEIGPDPRMEGSTDCYLVSIDDIVDAEETLKAMLEKWKEKANI